ncbi:hypothetical protein R3P38DRAFT_3222637 [Favolaschia claudopus]|uniref:Uncharacterized protein n=1 Tax=Favolaschia claudopus TaxID=2862362 RepID=A0AAV9ZXY6_9AGAR
MPKAYTPLRRPGVPPRRPNETSKKPAPLTTEQQKEKRDNGWNIPMKHANKLAKRFDMKARYFLDIFSQGGAHMIHHQENTNPYNAFKSVKAAEAREQGTAMTGGRPPQGPLPRIPGPHEGRAGYARRRIRQDEAAQFSSAPRHAASAGSRCFQRRSEYEDARACSALASAFGLEGFFCIGYMEVVTRKKWSTSEVGMKQEAFAIAGCDAANMLRTSAQKINFMKGEIVRLLLKNLVDVSKVSDARLAWKWFEEDVVPALWRGARGMDHGAYYGPQPPQHLRHRHPKAPRRPSRPVNARSGSFSREEAADRLKKWEEEVSAGKVHRKAPSASLRCRRPAETHQGRG